MPRSKKPRKQYRPKVRRQLSGAEVLDDFFFRVESWESANWQIAARMHLLGPFDRILGGSPEERDWAQAKTNLIEGWATASEFEERDRIRREIRAANKLLTAAYTYFDQKHEVLTRNVEAARDVCGLILDMWETMNPGEVTQGCRGLGKDNGKALTWFEEQMEG